MNRAGQEIVYCSACSTRLRGTDFEKGRAHRISDQVFCRPCRPERPAEGPRPASRTSMKVPIRSSGQFRRIRTRRPDQIPEAVLASIAATVIVVGAVLLLRPSDPAKVRDMPVSREANLLMPAADVSSKRDVAAEAPAPEISVEERPGTADPAGPQEPRSPALRQGIKTIRDP